MTKKELIAANIADIRARCGPGAIISVRKAADYLGKDPRTLMADTAFPLIRIGKSQKVPVVGLAAWLSEGV